MYEALKQIIDNIVDKSRSVRILFNTEEWTNTIPSRPGLYWIKTNTPIQVLENVGAPSSRAHVNIPVTIGTTLRLAGLAIMPSEDRSYVIYNGEATNLKARAREHVEGHSATFCLGLLEYDSLQEYDWTFSYITLAELGLADSTSKQLRIIVEQAWRAEYGWPILCKK